MWVRVFITKIIQSFHLPRQADVQNRNSRYIMAVSFIQLVNTTVSIMEQELLTLPERVTWSLVYMFCRSLFVLLSSLFWSLCCLFFFDLQILITFGIFKLFLWWTSTICLKIIKSSKSLKIKSFRVVYKRKI
jgi:hypothetical protein